MITSFILRKRKTTRKPSVELLQSFVQAGLPVTKTNTIEAVRFSRVWR
jgi:hypothetical protein